MKFTAPAPAKSYPRSFTDLEESLKWRTCLEGILYLKIIIQSELDGIDDIAYSNQIFVSYQ
jgi:hypothetical protein